MEKIKIDYLKCLQTISGTFSFMGLPYVVYGLNAGSETATTMGFGFALAGLFGNIICLIKAKKEEKEARKELASIKEKNVQAITGEEMAKMNDIDWLKCTLLQIGLKCESVFDLNRQAAAQIEEIQRLGDSINSFEKVAYKKAYVKNLKEAHEKVYRQILQNCRDVVAICIAGEAADKGTLCESDIDTIKAEIKSSKETLDKLKVLMRDTGRVAIQNSENDVFANIELDSSIKAISSIRNTTSLQ